MEYLHGLNVFWLLSRVNDHIGIIKFIDNLLGGGITEDLKNVMSIAHLELLKRSKDCLNKK